MDLTKTSNGKYCSRSSRNLLAQKTLEADPRGTRAMSSTGHPLDTSHQRSLEGPPGALPALPQTSAATDAFRGEWKKASFRASWKSWPNT
jgi:hypothetical protein